ncbi:MAG: sigma-54-dependent Fis family transcriptional regulator [Candidatus Hydrogenedentes bacterium]|nr:sigma-54-dependent Fis family transcriptional regulator [Candidatus Hydrogenedentota bacterium]
MQHRVLVVDDESSMRELLEIVLAKDGYDVVTLSNVNDAIEKLSKEAFDVVLTDLRMGTERDAGMQLLEWLTANSPTMPAIMMTAYGSVETAIEAMKRGAADYMMKPFKNDEVRLLVKRAIEQRNLKRENLALRKDQANRGRLENIVGKSRPVEELREMIRRVADLPSTVAIYGESGTGKELVARGIHSLSSRAQKPFVAVNCGGFPENLLESELFGHKKGSFTGAYDDKEGLFVVADGGTLFLDEIGEMPMSLQVKLLRVLDNNIVFPVGGTQGIKVDVRIISATNKKLDQMVKEGTFREDLYYRLNVIPVHVPSLRDRSDDIPLLTRAFVSAHATKMARGTIQITPEAESALQAFNWPGNVRELMNVLERAVALCRDSKLEITDLPQYVREIAGASANRVETLPDSGFDLEKYVAEIETNLIQQALQNTKYSQKRAAGLLGLTARSLRYRLKKYGLESD